MEPYEEDDSSTEGNEEEENDIEGRNESNGRFN